ncbi:tetratricopeptide repeat protein [Pedobacter gandavensis]|uniref:tetratricopeptide repeat-containing sensor histidine kinase n=1 Tax=Pedobacter gandavensis TaxID=2679963 RepID=UPI00292EE328|nr:tetratricopeptide repeat protein [Pedobacter gandavensis]
MKYFYLLLLTTIFFYACTKEIKTEQSKDNLFYDKAFELRDKNISDSSFFFFNKAKEVFLQQKDSFAVGKCLVNMAIISTKLGDSFTGQELGLNAIAYLDKKKEGQYYYIHSNLNNLGIATHNLENYERAVEFFDSAMEFCKDSTDTRLYMNNKARTYQVLAKYKEALEIYNQILRGASKNRKEYARALTNIAATKLAMDSNYNAAPDYLKALAIRKEEKELLGLNSSYSHLSDFYARTERDSALYYAALMYEVAKKMKSTADQINAISKLIKLSPAPVAQEYFPIYKDLDDSLQRVYNTNKNQFALIHYETEKHKTDFLQAQAENVKKQNKLLRQNFALGILGLVLIGGYWFYRKRKKELQQEKELEVKNTEIKYVKKIHDRVANKVYQVMSEVENTPALDRDALLDKLENLYNVSRDISYEEELNTEKGYAQQLSKMLSSYASENIEVFIIGNDEELWEGSSKEVKTEIFCILQELMTNMKKHSQANSVVLKFTRNEGVVSISYADNGIGIKDLHKKNGLTNTETRINGIRGTIIFDTTLKEGLKIQLLFPFS